MNAYKVVGKNQKQAYAPQIDDNDQAKDQEPSVYKFSQRGKPRTFISLKQFAIITTIIMLFTPFILHFGLRTDMFVRDAILDHFQNRENSIPIAYIPASEIDTVFKSKVFGVQSLKNYPMDENIYFISILSCDPLDIRKQMLCSIYRGSFCSTNNIAELLNSTWVIAPIYTFSQTPPPLLYRFHHNFKDYIESFGLQFCTIEGIVPSLNQHYQMTSSGKEPYEIQIKLYDMDYIRENMLNVAIKKLPEESWEYAMWIDAHQLFNNSYWWYEAIVKMEHFSSVQLFQTFSRINSDNTTVIEHTDSAIRRSLLKTDIHTSNSAEFWPAFGGAYGIRKSLYKSMEYILDTCIGTFCDLHYVLASTPSTYTFHYMDPYPNYINQFKPWINRTREIFKSKRAFVLGELIHFEHERIINFAQAPKVLNDIKFNAALDLDRDENFTIFITNPAVKEAIEEVFAPSE